MSKANKAVRLLVEIDATKRMLKYNVDSGIQIEIERGGVTIRDTDADVEIVTDYENTLKAARWIIEMLGDENVKD
jgi:hypothetical protein